MVVSVTNYYEKLAWRGVRVIPGGGELPYILVRDVPFFGVPFLEQEINFGVSFLVRL